MSGRLIKALIIALLEEARRTQKIGENDYQEISFKIGRIND